MPATLFNAPVRPLLTGLVILALSMAILSAAAVSISVRAAAHHDSPASPRPRFARRMPTLPAVVVTAPMRVGGLHPPAR